MKNVPWFFYTIFALQKYRRLKSEIIFRVKGQCQCSLNSKETASKQSKQCSLLFVLFSNMFPNTNENFYTNEIVAQLCHISNLLYIWEKFMMFSTSWHMLKKSKTHTNTNTKTKTKTKCLKDPPCAIFLKSRAQGIMIRAGN